MLQFILNVPNWMGWMLVGILASACAYLFYRLALVVIEMVRDYREERKGKRNGRIDFW